MKKRRAMNCRRTHRADQQQGSSSSRPVCLAGRSAGLVIVGNPLSALTPPMITAHFLVSIRSSDILLRKVFVVRPLGEGWYQHREAEHRAVNRLQNTTNFRLRPNYELFSRLDSWANASMLS